MGKEGLYENFFFKPSAQFCKSKTAQKIKSMN